jgi:predicted transcriptional regulator of viral defense system
MSALAFHGLTDQMPRKVWIAIGVSAWEPYFSGDTEKHSISGTMVPIYSIEKSFCNAFQLPKLVDRSVAIESLKSALTDRKTTPAKIANAAKKYRAWNQISPYLEALTN